MLLVSPAEPKALYKLGEVSSLPEQYGVDFLWTTPHGMAGAQRKEVRDLIASIRGDRICRELGQSKALVQTVLLIEGDWRWRKGVSQIADGFTRAQYDGLLLSFQAQGWWVLHSENLRETAEVLARMKSWFARGDHLSLLQRPKSRAPWGTRQNKEWCVHAWQTFEGIGVGMAGVLTEHLGFPVAWTVGEEELLAVPGIGKGRAKKLLAALDGHGMVDASGVPEEVK
jgi:ERCC4-type nuclease